MVAIYQTYPRLKQTFTQKDLDEVYTPTAAELRFALRHCKRGSTSFLGLLVQLKIVQRLGRFVTFGDVPTTIIQHIKQSVRNRSSHADLSAYFSSGAKDRHIRLIRQHLKLRPYDTESTNDKVLQWATSAAKTKEALADIINVALEYLVKEQFELPPFSVLQRLCQSARSQVNNIYYDQLVGHLNAEGRAIINRLLNASGPEQLGRRDLKQEAKRPTPRNIQAYIRYLEWLSSLQSMLPTDLGLPPTKHQQCRSKQERLPLQQFSDALAPKTARTNCTLRSASWAGW